MARWIGLDLAVWCAEDDGRVLTGVFFDHAVRAALLVDLALYGRLRLELDDGWLDTTPTGFGPADDLLAYVAAHPEASLGRAISSGPGSVLDLLGTTYRRFGRRRRFEIDPGAAHRVAEGIVDTLDLGTARSPADAALAALAAAVNFVAPRRRDDLIGQSGPARALVGDCVTYLLALREKFDMVAIAGRVGSDAHD